MKDEITLHRKNGETFTGSARECAIKLGSDALHHAWKTGQPYALWEVQDFCEQNGVDWQAILDIIDPQKHYIFHY